MASLLGDSQCRYAHHHLQTHGIESRFCPGAYIEDILVGTNATDVLDNCEVLILHVRTNNVAEKTVQTIIMKSYEDLLEGIRSVNSRLV